jgi:hypothetical protein
VKEGREKGRRGERKGGRKEGTNCENFKTVHHISFRSYPTYSLSTAHHSSSSPPYPLFYRPDLTAHHRGGEGEREGGREREREEEEQSEKEERGEGGERGGTQFSSTKWETVDTPVINLIERLII